MKTGKLQRDTVGYCLSFSKSRDNDRAHSNSRWRRLQMNMWSFDVF